LPPHASIAFNPPVSRILGLRLKVCYQYCGVGGGLMRINRALSMVLALAIAAALAVPVAAQQPGEPGAPAPAKPAPPKRAPKPRPREAAPKPAKPPAPLAGAAKPTLLGQYGDWGAYTASPGGKKVCFAIAKPKSAETRPPDRPRNEPYMFISIRPADKVTNEVSVVVGYPFKTSTEATAEVGSTTFALYTQGDGAWIKNAGEEAHMVEAMRQGESVVVRGMSSRGTQSTDTYSLKGLAEALDRVAQECK
jgi:invasion associated locus B (IalB) protein